jgi:tRNA(adenine34) deaminase
LDIKNRNFFPLNILTYGSLNMKKKYSLFITFLIVISAGSYLAPGIYPASVPENVVIPNKIDEYEKEINSFKSDSDHPDDVYIIAALKEAIAGKREGNGAIGACLVDEKSGRVIETGHNRQFKPFFRSNLHAEMDMLDRYETRIKMQNNINGKRVNPRTMYQGLILYSTLEPCMMCLGRIINAGIPKVYFAASDDSMGFANNRQCLPPYWKEMLEKNVKYESAKCSPRLKEIAADILYHKK